METPAAFRMLQADHEEAVWLRDKDTYDETWWETEFAELAMIANQQDRASRQA